MKVYVRWNTSIALYLVPIRIVLLRVEELSPTALKVNHRVYGIDSFYFNDKSQKIFKIAHVMSIVQMVAPAVQIRYASVVRILHPKINSIWKHVEKTRVLIWGRALLDATMTKDAKIHASMLSKHNTKNVPVR